MLLSGIELPTLRSVRNNCMSEGAGNRIEWEFRIHVEEWLKTRLPKEGSDHERSNMPSQGVTILSHCSRLKVL